MDPVTEASPDKGARGVGKRARRGLRWTLLGTVGANLLRLGVIPALGRLLSPDEFGSVAAALTIIAFGQMLRDIGLGAALVQRKELSQEQIDASVGMSLALGIALGIATAAVAPLVANFYDDDGLIPMVRVLAVMFVIRAFGSVPRALCEREMLFRALSIADFASFFLGSVVSVSLAAAGAGVWSLIVGYLLESAVVTLAVFVVRPTRVHLRIRFEHLRGLLGFGAGTTAADIAQYFANFGDYLVVGAMRGQAALGLYTRAYELMRFPSAVFTNVARFVLFSAFARLQDDRERLGRAFRRGTFLTAAILLPASVGLIVLAPELIRILLGAQWSEAILPFQILSVSMMARTSWKIGGTLARAAGDVYAVAIANVAYAVLVVVGALIGIQWGIVGVSIAIAIECTIHYLIYSYLGIRNTTLGWGAFLIVHVEALVASAIAFGLIAPVTWLLREHGAADVVVLATAIALGVLSLVVSTMLGVLRKQQDWIWLRDNLRDQLQGKRAKPTRSAPSPRSPD